MFWKGKKEENLCFQWHHSANTEKVKLGMLLRRRHIGATVGVLAHSDTCFQLIISFLGRMIDLLVASPGWRGLSEDITVTKLNEIELEQNTFQIAKQMAENSSSGWENYIRGCLFSKTKSDKKVNLVSAAPLSELITEWGERGASFAKREHVFDCSGWKQSCVLVFWGAPCWEQIGRESCAAQREGFVFLVNNLNSCW